MNERLNVDISNLNTFALSCIARHLISFDSISDVQSYFEDRRLSDGKFIILGGGSNMLLPENLDTTVLHFTFDSLSYTELESGDVLVEVEAGKSWDQLVGETVEKGLIGLENLSYIPGSVGAAPVQNIGAYGVELSDVIESVRVFDTVKCATEDLTREQCRFAYRDSIFKQNPGRYCILSIKLRLSKHAGFNLEYGELKVLQDSGAELTVANIREKVVEVRRAKLPEPEIIPNAGSFFKNPIVSNSELSALKSRFPGLVSYDLGNDQAKLAAGWLIDNAGWKGKCSEKVGVHAKQALVLVNLGGASLEDVLTFAGEIQESILSKYSVRLEIEPNIIY